MPLIIDANVANECLIPTPDAEPVIRGLMNGKIRCVSGQRHKAEMLACRFRSIYRQLLLAGRLTEFPEEQIDAAERDLPQPLASDDPHILALAIASGARVLFSRDQPLHSDFTNKDIINTPRGRVYQNADQHKHLLAPNLCG